MATTTANCTINSDLLQPNLNASKTSILMKGGTSSDGLEFMDMGYIEVATGTNFDLLNADNALNKDKANKVYISNESTDETYYVVITIDATVIGRLYAGDWMFIPWGAEDANADIEIQAYTGTNKITYAYFHENRTLTSA
jgi:hypothetical protein|tara:strand:- start:381 stop:800 length:420 start_codon:yes stop_codon:yes gene_type:complete